MNVNAFLKSIMMGCMFLVLSGCSGEDIDTKPRVGFEGAVYEEGIHYREVDSKADYLKSDVSVFFWYQCPHCNSLRPAMNEWVAKNQDVTVEKIHSLISQSWINDQMLYQALKKRGIFNESYDPLFDHIHGENNGKKPIEDILRDAGLSVEPGTLSFSPEEKEEMVKEAKEILEMEKAIGATGVPYIVVKGKYLLKNTAFSSYEEMMHAAGWIIDNK